MYVYTFFPPLMYIFFFLLQFQLVQLVLTSMEFHLDSAEYCQAQHK